MFFHLGVAKQLGISFGTVIILTGAAVLLLWIPIRQMPGLGTVSNVIVLGLAGGGRHAGRPAAAGVAGGRAVRCW
ncbi:membrane protein [Klebsiella pneumoniae]|nr:membrane protein [Klebsiella pneumoniae]